MAPILWFIWVYGSHFVVHLVLKELAGQISGHQPAPCASGSRVASETSLGPTLEKDAGLMTTLHLPYIKLKKIHDIYLLRSSKGDQ